MKLFYVVVYQVVSLAILPLALDYKLASSVVQAHLMAVLCPQVDDFFSQLFHHLTFSQGANKNMLC